MNLTIELVPRSCWYSNVRSNVSEATWSRLKSISFKAANYRCEICSNRGPHHPVECHEIWHYDDHRLIQRLDRLIALCPRCHQVKHIGLAIERSETHKAIEWLCHVNSISPDQALQLVKRAFAIHEIRSAYSWSLDLSLLSGHYQVRLAPDNREAGLNRPSSTRAQ